MRSNVPVSTIPQFGFPVEAGNQNAINAVRIFTSNDNPLLTSVEVVITLVPDDPSGMYRSYWPIAWRILSFPANVEMQYVIEIPDVVGLSTITDKGDGVFACVNRTTVTVGNSPMPERYLSMMRAQANQQHHEFTFKNNRWESRLNMSIPPNVVKMKNVCGKSDVFGACAIMAGHGAESILHLGTLTLVVGCLKFRRSLLAIFHAAMVTRRPLNGLLSFRPTYPISIRVCGICSCAVKKADAVLRGSSVDI
ncbi:hypothetical protein EV401DRAFT_1150206 [Pisolithus croceorrhizus]|nr:hypothetical protein EV401DRAFT_1150206 [Pisolithus croceorrhizus]